MKAVKGTQAQIVEEKLGNRGLQQMTPISERIAIPGIENLHLRSAREIAEVLANIIKSRASITSLKYEVGSHIEVTSISDLSLAQAP